MVSIGSEVMDSNSVEGSCLCGQIKLQLNGELHSVRYCHCSNCRKFAGTSPAAWAMANAAELKKSGESEVGRYDSSRGIRCFCQACGSPVWFESKNFPNVVGIPLGVIDSGYVPSPAFHLWLQSKPAWCLSNDGLPAYLAGPDSTVATEPVPGGRV